MIQYRDHHHRLAVVVVVHRHHLCVRVEAKASILQIIAVLLVQYLVSLTLLIQLSKKN